MSGSTLLLLLALLASVACLRKGPLRRGCSRPLQSLTAVSCDTKLAPLRGSDSAAEVKASGRASVPLSPLNNGVKSLMMLATVGLGSLLFAPDAEAASSLLAGEDGVYSSLAAHWKYFLCGATACTVSHGVTVPFDVVKTRIQTSSAASPGSGEATAAKAQSPDYLLLFREIAEDKGAKFLFQGMGPTLVGYAVHGFFKYGLYETFKPLVGPALSEGLGSTSPLVLTLLVSAFAAEVVASYFLCPFEASRIRLVASPQFAGYGLISTMRTIYVDEGAGSLFRGLPALLCKHIPYTVTQLTSFELVRNGLLGALSVENPEDYRFVVTIVSALFAAFFASLASQPGDTLLSVINKKSRLSPAGSALSSANPLVLMKELGLGGLFVGTQARLVHVSIIVVVQLVVYDYVKALFGLAAGH